MIAVPRRTSWIVPQSYRRLLDGLWRVFLRRIGLWP